MINISVSHIDAGIKLCLDNTENILQSNLYILEHNMFHTRNLELVLYYYALEEYGKAIKLKQDKDIAIQKKRKIITPGWWYKHDSKILAVREKHSNKLDILNKGIYFSIKEKLKLLLPNTKTC